MHSACEALAPYRDGAPPHPRPYADLHAHVLALERAGLLHVIDESINKDTEMHPLVRWQYRGGIAEADRRRERVGVPCPPGQPRVGSHRRLAEGFRDPLGETVGQINRCGDPNGSN